MKWTSPPSRLLLAGLLLPPSLLNAQQWQGNYSASGGGSAAVYKIEMNYWTVGGNGSDANNGWELVGDLRLSLRDRMNTSVKDFGAFAVWDGGAAKLGRHDWSGHVYYYCGSSEQMNGGRVVISSNGMKDADGSLDGDDAITTPEQTTSLSGLTIGGAPKSISANYSWTSSGARVKDGDGSLSVSGRVSLISQDDVPQSVRGSIDCGAEAGGKFKIVESPDGSLLVTASPADFTGDMKSMGTAIAGTYTAYGGPNDYARNNGQYRFILSGDAVTFHFQGKPYTFNREAGATSNVIHLPGQAGASSGGAIGKWYGANVGDPGIDITAGVDHELAFWVNGKSFEFDVAETQPSKITKLYKQAGGSSTMKVSAKKLTIDGVQYYKDAPKAGVTRGGGGSSDTDVFALARMGDLETIAELKDEGMADLEARNSSGQTPLLAAAAMNKDDVVSGLIGLGASATVVGTDGKSALDHAVAKGNLEMAKTLMDNGCRPNEAMIDASISKPEIAMELVSRANNPGLAAYAVTVASKKGNTELFKSLVEANSVPLSNAHFNNAVADRRMEIALYVLDAPGIDMNAALQTSLGSGLKPLIERCLNKGADAAPALAWAVDKGDIPLATFCITQFGAQANGALPAAVVKGSAPMVNLLLDNGGEATVGLQAAVDNGSQPMAKLLLDRGADASAQLPNASGRGHDAIVQAMIEKGGDPNLGMQPAIENDKASTVQLLVNAGADPNPAIGYAVEKGNASLLDLLVSKGGDATAPDLMAKAAGRGDVPVLNVLLNKASADPNPGMLPAVTQQGSGVLDLLIRAGGDATPPALIAKAVERGDAAMATMLMDKGADPDNATLIAIRINRPDLVTLLKSRGGDLSRTGFVKESAKHNNPALTGMLLDAGAQAQEGVSPAVDANAGAVLELLRSKGADLTDKNLLVKAVNNGSSSVAPVLVKAGCDARNYVDPGTGGNLLHIAAQREDFPILSLLVGAKYDVNMKASGSGDTPLHVAARGGKDNLDAVMALVDAGADVNALNGRGKSVVQEAKGPRVRKYIKENGGERKPEK